ncbi:MAG: alpha/beta fold hydrolase [Gammaproteobacteria bacterium]|nr:alpha/beta fold hydrolase [Gammaproteobacteria bacterium]
MICQELRLPARDGYALAASLYLPDTEARQAVLVNSAMAVPRRYYAAFARHLCERGAAVLTYDYRGVGDSRDRHWRQIRADYRDWGEKDQPALLDWLHGRFPAASLRVLGHSAGGQIFGLADNNALVARVLAVASGSGYHGHWRGREKLKLLPFWYLFLPASTALMGYFPGPWFGMLPLPAGVARQWARFARNRHYVSDAQGQALRQHFHGYRGAMRFLAISDDPFYAPEGAVRALAGYYANARTEVALRHPCDYGMAKLGHFGFFRDSTPRAAWDEAADWLLG